MSERLKIMPIGGIGEFGMNCAILAYKNDWILIDGGMSFPRTDQGLGLGVQIIVPDTSFLLENREKIRALFLTHGHEDHAGAVSFLVQDLDIPIYGSALTLGLVSERLSERKLLEKAQLHEIEARQKLSIGPFEIEPLHVTHSYPDSFCFAIGTPLGNIIWTGDFKFDQTPIDGKITDLHRLAAYGEKGVLALFSDSTNSIRDGLAPSESSVIEPLRDLFRTAPKKIIASTFSSSIHRLQIFFDLAREFDRSVLPVGRSLVNNVRVARKLGYLEVSEDQVIHVNEARHLEPNRLLVLASGSQGEPMSALSRLAINQFKNLKVESEDLVILSTRIIPGNEKSISRLINHLFRRGARVCDSSHAQVHVSGHGYRDDLKLMINLTKPRFFVPTHGEYRNLMTHTWIAQDQGMSPEDTLLIENGDVLEIGRKQMKVTDRFPAGRRFIDEGALEEVHEAVLRERRFLAEDGFLAVILQIDRLSGDLLGEPEIVSRGFVQKEESDELFAEARERIISVITESSLEEKRDEELFREILRKELRRLLRKRTGKRPVIVSFVLEI